MTTMEDLTKTQIILLTLLVSFVTSIATGIITTSLLAEAPASVTQTINRVVERTIEKVSPTTTTGPSTKEVTVIKEEDAVMKSIDSVSDSIVRIKAPVNPDGTQDFYALGAIVSNTGLVVSDKRGVILGGAYSVVLSDGTNLPTTVSYVSDDVRLAIFKINPDSNHQSFTPVIMSSKTLRLGQSIIAIQGREKNVVGFGRVTSLNNRTEKNLKGNDIQVNYSAETDLDSTYEIQGSLLINLSGELVGIKSSNEDLIVPAKVYTTIPPIQGVLAKIK